MPHEIINLQLGHYSNYVGTHWWNLQESAFNYSEDVSSNQQELSDIDPDAMFREGLNHRGEVTFTPRLIQLDLKGSMGCLPLYGTLYGKEEANETQASYTWDNNVQTFATKLLPKNEFLEDLSREEELYEMALENGAQNGHNPRSAPPKKYDLRRQIQTWSDYKRVHYHPRSTLIVNNHLHGDDSFNHWVSGFSEGQTGVVMAQMEETVRFYAEECDAMQGFNVVHDLNNGFGGLATSVLQYLSDEFSGKTTAVFPTLPPEFKSASTGVKKTEMISTALTLSSIMEHGSLVIPLGLSCDLFRKNGFVREFPFLDFERGSSYHSSAILASSLESLTSCYRTRDRVFSMSQLAQNLTSGSRNLLSAGSAFPLPYDITKHDCFPDFLCDFSDANPWTTLTPSVEVDKAFKPTLTPQDGQRCYAQNVVLSGFKNEDFLSDPLNPRSGTTGLHLSKSLSSMLKLYLSERFPNSVNNSVRVVKDSIQIKTPFPHIFGSQVQSDGFIQTRPKKTNGHSDKFTNYLLNGDGPLVTNGHAHTSNGQTPSENGDSGSNMVETIPTMTILQSTSKIASFFQRCHSQSAVMKRWPSQCRNTDVEIERETLDEAIERFQTLEKDYRALEENGNTSSD